MNKVLALTKKGELTYCTAPEDMRGRGRCNHIAHIQKGQSVDDFIKSISSQIMVEDNTIPDQQKYVNSLVKEYANSGDPDWEGIVRSLDNQFNIGSKEDGTYEEATIVGFDQQLIEKDSGNVFHLVATYEFNGRLFECDYGEVPVINDDNTITINNVNWRVLPVVEQNKAGLISYNNNIVVKQVDGRNISFMMSKDPDDDTVTIYGKKVPIEDVQTYLKTKDISKLSVKLNSGQIYALDHIDPIVYERFPNFNDDLTSLKQLQTDQPGDLTYRRVIRYEDIVKEQMRLQMRRMGVTFRSNYAKRQKYVTDNGLYYTNENILSEDLDNKYPLFYQVNLSENIKSDLIKRSNVQNADNLNPIAALSQAQKISFTGKGGFNKDSAPYDLRMPHKSHEYLIDSMDISSGKNVGLTGTLSGGYIGSDRMIHQKPGPKSLAPSDFIPFKNYNDPSRGIMAVAHMKQACPITGGEDPIVSTPGWDKIKGAKLGVNLRIAYLPTDGVYEDAVVISESAAEKMATIQSQSYECNDTSKLKVGQRVERKEKYGNSTIKVGGVITKINKNNSYEVETTYKMTPGDKLAGRHGNKSVVSKVVPDNEMPKIIDENGNAVPAQVIMSPLSIVGRKNLGQVMETNEAAGKGTDINTTGTVIVGDKKVEATNGIQYILRLNHIAEKKLSSHADELDAKRESEGSRLGEMESILLSTSPDRLKVLKYLRHQEAQDSHKKLHSLLKAVGVDLKGVNWDD